MPPIIQLACTVLDCQDPAAMAAFYQAACAGQTTHQDDDSAWVTVFGTTWIFRKTENHQPPTWPRPDTPLQIHMDFLVDDLATAEKQLHALGATTPPNQPHDHDHDHTLIVMLDPAGHPFCIATRN